MKRKPDEKLLGLLNYREKDPSKIIDKIAKTYPKLTVSEIPTTNFGMLNSVGKASEHLYTPRAIGFNLHIKNPKVTLLGKGITYDSGGYALKPADACTCCMYFDKTGAMLVAAYCAKYNIPGYIFLTPNLIGSNGTVNGTVVTAYDGTKVEISNTDAEGRLGLGDLLAYIKEKSPKTHVLSIATLTGHAGTVSGTGQYAILNTTNKKLAVKSASRFLEDKEFKIWPLPHLPIYDTKIKSGIIGCDIQNLSYGAMGGAGTQMAYAFLKHFNSNSSLLDIATMAYTGDRNALGWGIDSIHKLISDIK